MMKKSQVQTIVAKLNEAGVRYLVAGGVAVIAHGHVRYTNDLDLVIHLDDENLSKAVEVFKVLGYQPSMPVKIEDFAIAAKREDWIENKKALVFSLRNPKETDFVVDIFLRMPFDFNEEICRSELKVFENNVEIPVVNLDTLISMKTGTGRMKDSVDLEQLLRIKSLIQEKSS